MSEFRIGGPCRVCRRPQVQCASQGCDRAGCNYNRDPEQRAKKPADPTFAAALGAIAGTLAKWEIERLTADDVRRIVREELQQAGYSTDGAA